jgi:hypothetical protein
MPDVFFISDRARRPRTSIMTRPTAKKAATATPMTMITQSRKVETKSRDVSGKQSLLWV